MEHVVSPVRTPSSASDASLAHLALRLVLGTNLTAHGLVRIGQVGHFADGMVAQFAATMLPGWTVRAFATTLPFVELGIGLALLLGVRLRAAALAGAVEIAMLTFGACLLQAWEIVGLQLLYAFGYAALLHQGAHARWTVDAWLLARSADRAESQPFEPHRGAASTVARAGASRQ